MKVTAILCTYNRCQSLAKTLDSLAASILPETIEWEVLVVDNNSTDQTRSVLEDFSRRYPGRFRYVFEPRQGLSRARNTGIHESKGDILAFVDDDVTVEQDWLQNLTACLHDGAWAGAGGRTLPKQTVPLPSWFWSGSLGDLHSVAAAVFDLGDEPRQLDCPPYGTNMAFRRAMFEKYGDFRTDLGRSGKSLMGGEDTEFGHRLLKAGERLRYEPSAIVYHPVREDRLKKEYFLRWYFDHGRAEIREEGVRPEIWGIPRHYISIPHDILRKIPKRALQWMLTQDPRQRFFMKCLLWRQTGRLVEMCRLSRHETKKSGDAAPIHDAGC